MPNTQTQSQVSPFDTPIGVGGKIDTTTGQTAAGTQAGVNTPGGYVPAGPAPTQQAVGTPTPIPVNNLTKSATPAPVTTPAPATGLSSVASNAQSQVDAYTQGLTANATATKTANDNSLADLIAGLKGQTGPAEQTNAAYTATVDPAQAAVQDTNSKIAAEQHATQREIQALKLNPQGLFGDALNQKIQEIQDKSNARLADLSVIQMAQQGKYDSAKAIADRAVAANLEKQKNYIDALQLNYQNNKDLFTKAEQRQFEAAQKTRQDALDLATYKEKARYDAMIKNSSFGSGSPATDANPSYTLKPGDDPYNIAQANGTDLSTLQKLNPNIADWHNIQPGVKLNLPLPEGTLSTDPTIDSYANGILNGSITSIAGVPTKYRDSVQAALNRPGQNGYPPLASSRFSMASNRIVSNYISLPQYQLTANGLPYLQRIDAAIKTPGSISDQDLLDSLTKLNTSGNAISDAQVKLITDGKSFSDVVNTFANKFKNGGVLSTNQRNQIQEIAKAIYQNYKEGYQPVYDQATKQLQASGIPKAFWTIPDLNNLSDKSGVTNSINQAPQPVLQPDQIPAGYYQASDGLLYKK